MKVISPHEGQTDEEVQVMTRAPAAPAPTQALMALCSLDGDELGVHQPVGYELEEPVGSVWGVMG